MQNKPVVLVTGASRGIGAEIAKRFAENGYHVGIHFRKKENAASELLNEIIHNGFSGELVQADMRDSSSVKNAVDTFVTANGRLDILVNNAGVLSDALFPLMTESQWEDVIDTTVHGCFRFTRAAVDCMLPSKSGAIVNIASVAALKASPGQANYAAAKGAIVAFTRTLAVELAGNGVRVNAVVPGLIDTGMTSRMNRDIRDAKVGYIPMQRMGQGSEIADAVYFLASDKASYITGQVLAVDGGLCAL
ncbi:MAG: SDR family oxidoreductase [Fibrobacterota bacterium]|nr:SDR family NAD(P)-dependent oxidoreductase [Chitinispirillaceae bacterium]